MWAKTYIEELLAGGVVQFRPRGKSMEPRVPDSALVTVRPIEDGEILSKKDVVLCKVRGRVYLHLIKAVKQVSSSHHASALAYLIRNNKGGTNGWTRTIYGVVTKIEP